MLAYASILYFFAAFYSARALAPSPPHSAAASSIPSSASPSTAAASSSHSTAASSSHSTAASSSHSAAVFSPRSTAAFSSHSKPASSPSQSSVAPPAPSPHSSSTVPTTSTVPATSTAPATSTSTSQTTSQTTSQSAVPTGSSIPLIPLNHGKKNPKRGIGYAGDVPGDVINANQTNSLISWQYNWNNIPPDYLATSNIPYIPMQWGGANIDSFADDVKAQGATTILTFNEPDFVAESNMQPEDAASLWMQFIEPLKAQGIRLGGPAVTASPTGRPWLVSFLAACTNCTIDFLPLHWYGSGTDGFYAYLWDVHTNFPQYPIWITEYAETSPNDTVVMDFLNATITYMDTLDWIERYSWFGYFRPRPDIHYNLLRQDGGLNPLGQLYLGARTVHTENVTSGPTSAYQTLNGADNPTQAPATTWAAMSSASKQYGSLGSGLHVIFATMTLSACFFGALWTVL